jgi:NTP pyrophosphatase (non-canonical NTP hydrolase)
VFGGWHTVFDGLSRAVHKNSKEKGFWERELNIPEKLCLIHSEISEALEALRINNPQSEKIPEFSCVEEELADTIIRIMDLAGNQGWNVGAAIDAKIEYNSQRAYKHGNKRF